MTPLDLQEPPQHVLIARMIYGCQWRHVREQHITTVEVLKETGLRHIDTTPSQNNTGFTYNLGTFSLAFENGGVVWLEAPPFC